MISVGHRWPAGRPGGLARIAGFVHNHAVPLDVEPASHDDRDWAAALMARSEPWITLGRTRDSCRAVCHHPEHLVFIARSGRQRIGFLILQRRGVVGSPYLATICVEEQQRNRGWGRELLTWTEEYFKPQARHLFLCVSSFNPRARALYERAGFARVGELPDYFIEGASEILMHKRLR
jgi:ribosomal protein S18 acetylase RimI-like enzyme